jgi:hypothetical protein
MSFNVYQVIYKVRFAHPEDLTDNPLTSVVYDKEFRGNILAKDIIAAVDQINAAKLREAVEDYNRFLPEGKEIRYNFQYKTLKEELIKADVVSFDVFVPQLI